ncbi:MAG TPA: hypothetical protein DEP99_02415 [Nitrospiraceae bacterium]|nr:hypothetical protein [Nitrospiraceae bacterium]
MEMADYSLEKTIAEAGIHYPRSYDIAYRWGYVLQSIGALILASFYFFKIPYEFAGIVIFDIGIALSSMFLLVWKASIKRFILWCTFSGIAVQLLSLLPIPVSEKIFLIGLGLTLAGGAGLVGKEAYCFGFIEGWLLFFAYPIVLLANLFGMPSHSLNSAFFALIAFLQLSFLRKKLRQPLLKGCESNICVVAKGKEKD